jgi:mannose-6-phosphate isomerase
VHAIGEGITLAEVQQTSDNTYRIFDCNRVYDEGRPRELHTSLALDAIDFDAPVRSVGQRLKAGDTAQLVASPHFTTNAIDVAGRAEISLAARDSFTIYICTAGEVTLRTAGGEVALKADTVALVPADADEITLEGNATLLETYL